MESADPFNLTFVLYKCIIILRLQYFKGKIIAIAMFCEDTQNADPKFV